jgi:heme a synthase
MGSYRRLSKASTFATFLLIAVGGLVRATKSGLGCGDDWPTCNGAVVPVLNGRPVVIEYTHRLMAAVVIVLVAGLTIRAFQERRGTPKVVGATVAALVLVLSQAVLGMVVVRLHLEALSVALHLGIALALLGVLLYGGAAAAAADGDIVASDQKMARTGWIAAAAVFLLMLAGSYVTGRDAGTVFGDWPLMNGRLLPAFDRVGPDLAELWAIHFAHRALAVVVGLVVALVAVRGLARRHDFPAAARLAALAAGLYVLEVIVGALNVWTSLNEIVVFGHLVLGASIWMTLIGMALITEPSLVRAVGARKVGATRVAVEGGR